MSNTALAMKTLAPFVGTWNTRGRIKAEHEAAEQLLVATDIYEWLPGKCFLLHRVDARLGDQIVRSIEIIGWDADADELFSTSYDDKGTTSRFRCQLDGHDWKIDGNGIRFRGSFDDSWARLEGTWEMAVDDAWSPWMDVQLARAD